MDMSIRTVETWAQPGAIKQPGGGVGAARRGKRWTGLWQTVTLTPEAFWIYRALTLKFLRGGLFFINFQGKIGQKSSQLNRENIEYCIILYHLILIHLLKKSIFKEFMNLGCILKTPDLFEIILPRKELMKTEVYYIF